MRKLVLLYFYTFLFIGILSSQTGISLSAGGSKYYYSPNGKNVTSGTRVVNTSDIGFQLGANYYWKQAAAWGSLLQLQWLHYESEIAANSSSRFAGGGSTANFKFEILEASIMPTISIGKIQNFYLGVGVFVNATINDPKVTVISRSWNFFDQTSEESTEHIEQSSLMKRVNTGIGGAAGFRIPFKKTIFLGLRGGWRHGLRAIGTPLFSTFPIRQSRFSVDISLEFIRK